MSQVGVVQRAARGGAGVSVGGRLCGCLVGGRVMVEMGGVDVSEREVGVGGLCDGVGVSGGQGVLVTGSVAPCLDAPEAECPFSLSLLQVSTMPRPIRSWRFHLQRSRPSATSPSHPTSITLPSPPS